MKILEYTHCGEREISISDVISQSKRNTSDMLEELIERLVNKGILNFNDIQNITGNYDITEGE